MSYQIKKHKKVILDPLSTFNDLFKKAETLYNHRLFFWNMSST